LSHALEKRGRGVGLHEVDDGDGADLGSIGDVLVDLEEGGAGDPRVGIGELIEGLDHSLALVLGDVDLSGQVRFEDIDDLGVGDVAEDVSVGLDAVTVAVLHSLLQGVLEVGDVVTGNSLKKGMLSQTGRVTWRRFRNQSYLAFLRVKAAEDVRGVTVVHGLVVDLGEADEISEGEDSAGVEELLLLDLLVGGEFLEANENQSKMCFCFV